MANQGDQTVFIGNSDWFRGDPVSIVPNTVLNPQNVKSMVGGYVRLDGSESHSLDTEDTLYFEWSLIEVPIDSQEVVGSLNPGPYTEWFDEILTKEVSLNTLITVFTMPGKTCFSACGKITSLMDCQYVKPIASAASY